MKRDFILAAVTLGLGLWAYMAVGWPGTGWLTFLAGVLVTLADEDWRTGYLPDALTLPLLVAGLVATWLLGWGLTYHLLGALAGALLGLAVVGVSAFLTGKPGWGGGDVKLLAALGAWGGLAAMLPIVLFSSCLATAWILAHRVFAKKRLRSIPFGPFLAAGGWLALLYAPQFWVLLLGAW